MSNAHYEPWRWEVPKTIIGERGHIPPDAHTKVVGTAEFTSDVVRPNMLYVKYYIAQRGAGRIKKLDTSKTEQVDGVVKVLRYDDKSIKWASDTLKPGNMTTFLNDRVYWAGHPVGFAVVAVSEYACDQAIKKAVIEWEDLPCEVDYNKALASKDLYREDINPQNNIMDKGEKVNNAIGDVEEGFKHCDHIIEFEYEIAENTPVSAEPMTCVCEFDNDDNCKIWFHGQAFNTIEEVVGEFVPQNKIDMHSAFNGGTFGGPISHQCEGWTAWLAIIAAYITRRPCKSVWEDCQFVGADECMGHHKWKVGYNNDGKIIAVDLDTVASGMMIGGEISKIKASTCIPNLRHTYVYPLYNRVVPGVFRDGAVAGTCQNMLFAHVAAALNMDPTEVALINDGGDGKTLAELEPKRVEEGFPAGRDSLKECLEKGKKAFNWSSKYHAAGTRKLADGRMHGVGFTWTESWQNWPYRRTRCGINVRYDGTVDVIYRRSCTGPLVALPYAQVVAAEMGMKLDDVIYQPDRHNVGFDTMSEASSSGVATNLGALVLAARKAKQNLLEYACKDAVTFMFGMEIPNPAPFTGLTPDALDMKDSVIFEKANPSHTATVKQVVQLHAGWNPIFQHEFSRFFTEAESDIPNYMDTALGRQCHFVEVAVDTDTGKVEILSACLVNDVGTAINPDVINGQQYGGFSMGMGRGNAQEVVYDPVTGAKLNDNMVFYPILGIGDVGPISCEIVETKTGYSPYGAVGLGECGCAATMGLTAAAVYNAIGKWVDIPTTPNNVLKALGKA